MDYFIQQLINGITLGGLYALIALGYTMVYGVIQLINFAHGEFFAAGGYVGVILLNYFAGMGYLHSHPWICLGGALIMTMAYCAFLAMAVEKVAYKPLRHSSRLAALLSALGMSIFLSNGLMLTQGVFDKPYPIELTEGGFEFAAPRPATPPAANIVVYPAGQARWGGSPCSPACWPKSRSSAWSAKARRLTSHANTPTLIVQSHWRRPVG